MRSEKISIALLNFNHSQFIVRSICAIKNQTLLPYELIIGDDCSTDNSIPIIKKYIKEIKWITLKINNKNLGVVENANSLLKLIKTDYVLFAAADDFLLPDYIERVDKLIKPNPRVGIITATALTYNETKGSSGFYASTFISKNSQYLSPNDFLNKLINFGIFIKGATSVYNTKLLKRFHGLDINFSAFCDSYVAIQLASNKGCIFDPCPGAVCQTLSSGYASSSMRDEEILVSMINYLERKKNELPIKAYKIISKIFITKLVNLNFFNSYKILFKESREKFPSKNFSKIINLNLNLKFYSFSRILIIYMSFIKEKINMRITSFRYKKRINYYNKYILNLISEIK